MKIDRLPPQALELEESILTSCLLWDSEEAVEILKSEDFYRTANQKIFSAIRALAAKKVKPDLPSVASALKDAGHLEEVGGAAYLYQLVDTNPVASNVRHYAEKIKGKAILRTLLHQMNEIANQCYDRQADPAAVIDEAQKRILSIDYQNGQENAVSYRDLALDACDRYEALSNRKDALTGIPSGFFTLDLLTCGFQDSDLIVLAARPSMGKTALMLNMAGNIGKAGIPVAIFSLEMSRQQLFDRQVAIESGVNLQKFRSGKFDQRDWQAIVEAESEIQDWPIFIDDTAALQHTEIRRRIRKMKKSHGIRIAFIDHLQLVRGDKSANRDREIGSITGELKAGAKEMNIPVVLLSQLNRKLEDRANWDKRPRMSDLRDSGNIEQDSDIIAFLYRDEVYNVDENNPNKGIAEINIAKQRNGPTGMVKLVWRDKTTSFHNLETRHAV